MSKFIVKIFLSIIFFSGIISAQQIKDLIQPLRLTAGQTDSILIGDIFYSENYNAKFYPDTNIQIQYFADSKKLIITPSENFEGIDLVNFNLDDEEYVIPVISEIKQKLTFRFKPDSIPNKVNLFGSFNSWNRESLPMVDGDKDSVYEITLSLEPGRYEYKFFVDGKELIDQTNPEQMPNGFGGFNSILTIKPRHTEKIYLHKNTFVENRDAVILGFIYESDDKEGELKIGDVLALIDNKIIPADEVSLVKNKINISLSKDDLNNYKTIRVVIRKNGISSNIQTVFLNNGEPVQANDLNVPQSKIMYALMIDRFFDGDTSNSIPVEHPELSVKANYQGGDLQGIIIKLNEGYFESLGINTIWLSPVIENTDSAYQEYPEPNRYYTGYHGYWPVHPTNVEERFGDMKLLKKLILTAHQKGIKVLLDYVAHHVHIEHPFWQEHRDWFGVLDLPDGRKNLRLWDEQRLTTWFEPYMPSFDYLSSAEALDTMTDNAVWWLKETGADGFRHDAVKHVPNEFWRLLTEKLKREIETKEKKFIYQIGETFGSFELVSSYVNNGQLSAQFNFNLYDTALPVFLQNDISFAALDEQMKKTFTVYGVNHTMGNILDSHDKVRYMAYADGDISLSSGDAGEIAWSNPPEVDDRRSYDKLKLHLSYLLTIPGIPVIYYGDEFGMTGAADPDNRRMMKFGNELSVWEKQTFADAQKIINIRRNHPALQYGDFYTLIADADTYSYLRSDFNERVLVVLNKREQNSQMRIKLPSYYTSKTAIDLITGEKFLINNNIIYLNLPSIGYKIFKIE